MDESPSDVPDALPTTPWTMQMLPVPMIELLIDPRISLKTAQPPQLRVVEVTAQMKCLGAMNLSVAIRVQPPSQRVAGSAKFASSFAVLATFKAVKAIPLRFILPWGFPAS